MSRGQKSCGFFFFTSHIDFLFFFGQRGDNCEYNMTLERKVGITKRPRLLNPAKSIATAICSIIVHVITYSERARA